MPGDKHDSGRQQSDEAHRPSGPGTQQQAGRERDSHHRNRQDPSQEADPEVDPDTVLQDGPPKGITQAGDGSAPG